MKRINPLDNTFSFCDKGFNLYTTAGNAEILSSKSCDLAKEDGANNNNNTISR